MIRSNRQFIFETQKFTRVQYLTDILGRLKSEVGTVFDCFKKYNNESKGKTGFWTGIRLLMPVIESVAKAIGKTPWKLLEEDLDVTAGSLVWQMFRHSLIHGDLLNHAKYGNQVVGWGLMMMEQGHIIKKNHISLDIYTLYNKLVEFLESEIAKNDQTIIEVSVGINYLQPAQYIIDNFNKLK